MSRLWAVRQGNGGFDRWVGVAYSFIWCQIQGYGSGDSVDGSSTGKGNMRVSEDDHGI
jgi:hypothetical protein